MSEPVQEIIDFLDSRNETQFRMRFEAAVNLSLLNYIESKAGPMGGGWSWSAIASPIMDHLDSWE